jgi:hypothetical protein
MPRRILQAQVTDHTNAFTGTWKLNPSRSKYASGQGPKSATITFAPDGSLTFQVVQIDGKRFKWSHEWSVRKEVPVNGIENGTIITKLQGNVVDDTMRISGQVVQIIQAVLSSDGIELTATITHLDEQRHALQDVQVFERQ